MHLYVQYWRKTTDCDIRKNIKCGMLIQNFQNVFSRIIPKLNQKTLFEFDLTTNESTGAALKKNVLLILSFSP